MAATQTVPQHLQHRNFIPIEPKHGVITLFGYGIRAHVDRGHLVLTDGVGPERRQARLPRVGHRLKRLVVIGADGMITLAALRWMAAHQRVAFVMLERNGSVLAITGPVSPYDVRLRRAQSLAHHSGAALEIARGLITQKLAGQLELVQSKLSNPRAAEVIARMSETVAAAETHDQIRVFESRAAYAYWSAWRTLPIIYPQKDAARVPDHWRIFGARISPLTGSPRLAVNPPNSMLNYCYSLAEAESCLAVSALGLDPGIGVLHTDRPNRNSLACDVLEAIRAKVDALVLDWITRGPLPRQWFFEERNGNARLMAQFAARLSETMPTWRSHVAPVAEWVARSIWTSTRKSVSAQLSTRLTQTRRRDAKGSSFDPHQVQTPRRAKVCQNCGKEIKNKYRFCIGCVPEISRENLIKAAHSGRVATVSKEAQEKRAAAQRKQAAALKAWNPSDKPSWLDINMYRNAIQPLLRNTSVPTIRYALGISELYATNIRNGRCIPHPRHWASLAEITGVTNSQHAVGQLEPLQDFSHS